ncbi:MAG: hypothetical protein CUN55_15750 [Phototrophicales bacterium]|nr:MAG: hypothetical protein CUN55_15750 [Phototrophicales bacterium]
MESFEFNDENCPHTFGELLRKWRRRYWKRHRKLSQEKLGDQIVVNVGKSGQEKTIGKNLISLWENGDVLPPIDASGIVIEAIVKALLCSPNEQQMLARAYICDVAKRGEIGRM